MDTFRILFVEDERSEIEIAEKHFSSNPRIKVRFARTLEEAKDVLKGNFFHAAVVDMQLADPQRPANHYGEDVLYFLRNNRPSCRCFLNTEYSSEHRGAFFRLLDPQRPTIHGALDKKVNEKPSFTLLGEMAEEWLGRQVHVEAVDAIYRELLSRKVRGSDVDVTLEEVDYLISVLLGQRSEPDHMRCGLETTLVEDDDLVGVKLRLLTGGKSSSVVAVGQPANRNGREGINCVIKIGPRLDSQKELLRYQRYVRFLVPLDRRVELFGYVLGDTLGAVCYSFAGDSPHELRSLANFLDEENAESVPKVMHVLDRVFDPDKKTWYANQGMSDTKKPLNLFFRDAYELHTLAATTAVDEFASRVAPRIGGRKDRTTIQLNGFKLSTVEDIIGKATFRRQYPSCIIHGDLNAGNLIVADDGRVIWIDFRHTTRGPRTLDFAALQVSVRLNAKLLDRDEASIAGDYKTEVRIWKQAWRDDRTNLNSPDAPYWAAIDQKILQLLRANFPDVTQEEHAATCLLWAMRIFSIPRLKDKERLRLLVWMSLLHDCLPRSV